MGDAPNAPYVVKHPKPPTDSVTRGPVMEITRGGQYKYDGHVLSEAKLVESLKSRLSKIDPDGVTIKLYSETPTAALLRTLKMNNISIKQIKVIR